MSVNTILNLGDDLMTNKFQLAFPLGIPEVANADKVALRMDQPIDPPADIVNEYFVFYKGMKIPFPGSLDESEKTLSMSVRVDQQVEVYEGLQKYKDSIFNSRTGTKLPNSQVRVQINVEMLDGQDNVVKTMVFKGAFLKSIKLTSWEPESGEPMRLELEWAFVSFNLE